MCCHHALLPASRLFVKDQDNDKYCWFTADLHVSESFLLRIAIKLLPTWSFHYSVNFYYLLEKRYELGFISRKGIFVNSLRVPRRPEISTISLFPLFQFQLFLTFDWLHHFYDRDSTVYIFSHNKWDKDLAIPSHTLHTVSWYTAPYHFLHVRLVCFLTFYQKSKS